MNSIANLSLRSRRRMAIFVTAVALVLCYGAARWEDARLGEASFVTGITLLLGVLFLMLLGVRRRLPFLPLGNASTWTQIHIYVGLFCAGVYWMHVPVLLADGLFESTLSILFLLVTGSGFYGLYASRTLPKKLTAVDGQHRFDRVPWHRDQIATAAAKVFGDLSDSSTGQVLEVFYKSVLRDFFGSRPTLAYVVAPTGNRRRRLLGDLKELDRYLEEDGRRAAGQFAALVRRRDDLDYQFALQLRLRTWVVVHSTLSLLLVAASIVHAALAFRFAL